MDALPEEAKGEGMEVVELSVTVEPVPTEGRRGPCNGRVTVAWPPRTGRVTVAWPPRNGRGRPK